MLMYFRSYLTNREVVMMGHLENVERILHELHNYADIDIFRQDGTCDWKAVRKAYATARVDKRELWYVLLEKNILSSTLKGHYIIIRNNHLWGPYFGWLGHLTFVRLEDAQGYFDNFYDTHGGLDDGHAQIIYCVNVETRISPQDD